MNYRRLGKSGLKVSELSLGAWITYGGQVGEEVATRCMAAAFDAGVNLFDNAEVYSNGNAEVVMGNVIKKMKWRREDLVVSTKVFNGGEGPNDRGLSRKHIFEGCKNSMKRLQVDYLDLYFCHRPDPNTLIEETVRAMDDLIHQGKVLYWGTSSWSAGDIMRAHGIAKELGLTPPTMEQSEYNMIHRDRVEVEYLPLYREIGLGVTVWSPLAFGLLTGKYNDGIPEGSRATLERAGWIKDEILTEKNLAIVRELEPIAKELDCTMAQLALAWCLRNPNVSTAITGASRPEQVVENMKAIEVAPKLDANATERIEGILKNKPALQD